MTTIDHPLPAGTRITYAFTDPSRGPLHGEATITGCSYITKSPTVDVPAYAVRGATTPGLQRIEPEDVTAVLSMGPPTPPERKRDRLTALYAAGWRDAAPQREAK